MDPFWREIQPYLGFFSHISVYVKEKYSIWLAGKRQLHMRKKPKETRYVDGTPTSEVTSVTTRYSYPTHQGYP